MSDFSKGEAVRRQVREIMYTDEVGIRKRMNLLKSCNGLSEILVHIFLQKNYTDNFVCNGDSYPRCVKVYFCLSEFIAQGIY